jgi:hypothetical protein
MVGAGPRERPDRVKLFCGLIAKSVDLEPAKRQLERSFGPIDLESPVVPFDYTDYYTDEMGPGLSRQWVSFGGLRERAYLARAKHAAVAAEEDLSAGGLRRVNIDPGYIDDAQVVLATSKNFSHRIYIGMGHYAEVTLIRRRGEFCALEWTYPDYQSPEGLAFFEKARSIFHREVTRSRET